LDKQRPLVLSKRNKAQEQGQNGEKIAEKGVGLAHQRRAICRSAAADSIAETLSIHASAS
jgi:hypothetical protein